MKNLISILKKEKWTIFSIMLTVLSVIIGSPAMLAADATVPVTEDPSPKPSPGQAGAETQLPGQPTTVSGVAEATGGVGGDGLIQPDIDEQITLIGTDEFVLDGLMRRAKRKVKVTGYEVDHYIIDEQKASVFTKEEYTGSNQKQGVIKLESEDQELFQEYGTVLVKGVDGYDEKGRTPIAGTDLMLYIVGKDSSNDPICRAINGPKTNESDEYCNMPTIPQGTELVILSNALAETQKEVAPDIIIPTPKRVFLQKTAMNQIVSDYFDAQKKRIEFQQATIAEAALKQYRRKNNRTLWVGRKGKFRLDRGKMGMQYVYFTEGVRWQFKREWEHKGAWTFEDIIALAKMKFTGQDCSKEAMWLMGRDQLEQIQNIDFTKHKDISMTSKEVWGFACTQLHTVFGDFYLKHEPTLDYIGYSNSGGIFDLNGLVRYYIKNEEKSREKIEGEEANRDAVISINALALKGYSHIWVNGDESNDGLTGVTIVVEWDNASEAPEEPKMNQVFYLKQACTGINASSKAGEFWRWDGEAWAQYKGEIYAKDVA